MAVVGGDQGADSAARKLARELGAELAQGGATVVTGGLGGVMEAACRGTRERGGVAVGILPGSDRRAANPYVSVAVPTGLGEARNALLVRMADVVIAVDGEFGTLSEIALALKAGKPVVGLGTWELARAGRPVEAIERAGTAAEAAARALELARPPEPRVAGRDG